VYPCGIVEGSWADRAYGEPLVYERHRHRFEVNNAYREDFEAVGFWPTGLSPDGRLVEIMEMADQPFMVGVQFHPEFLSRPNRPHPMFREFIGVAKRTLREGGQHELPLESPNYTRRV
jgi:CTP synthase